MQCGIDVPVVPQILAGFPVGANTYDNHPLIARATLSSDDELRFDSRVLLFLRLQLYSPENEWCDAAVFERLPRTARATLFAWIHLWATR